ncbi:MAG: acyltransferase [Isosphaeraceae bacterium]
MSFTSLVRTGIQGCARPSLVLRHDQGRPAVATASNPVETKTRRYQMLDVWRGLICLLVVLEHAAVALWERGGEGSGFDGWSRSSIVWLLTLNIGTPLFFVMSGYCIAASVESSRRKGHGPLAFLTRRFWRIFPTYWVALLGFVVFVLAVDATGVARYRQNSLSLELGTPRDLSLAQWVGNLTLTETWRHHLGLDASLPVVFTRVAWSLCYQEQFYIVCCLALWLAPRRFFPALGAATLAILGYRILLWDSGGLTSIEGTFLYAWHEFAVGLAVYWRLNAGRSATPLARRGVDAFITLIAVAGLLSDYRSTAAAGLFGLLLIGLFRWDDLAGRLACLEPLRACGRRSFSIYLSHLPVTIAGNQLLSELGIDSFWARALVMIPLVMLAAIAVGWVFHHLVERHFLGAPPSLRLHAHPALAPRLATVESVSARAA